MTQLCKRFVVSGRVQGVFYRDCTRKKALQLCLTGWVRNLANGDVELVACGEVEALITLEEWLWEGSPACQVQAVQKSEEKWQEFVAFQIL